MLPGDASRLVVYLGCDPSATHPDRTGKIRNTTVYFEEQRGAVAAGERTLPNVLACFK
jgi:hypothetical protein